MSFNKYIILAAVGVVSAVTSVAMAGGPDNVQMAAPAPMSFDRTGVYIDGNLGYASIPWNNQLGTDFFTTRINNVRGGFTGGGDIGYQWSQFLGLEIGGYYLSPVHASVSNFFGNSGSVRINQWFAYSAVKATVPLFANVDLFFKAGAAYRETHNKVTATIPPFVIASFTQNNNNFEPAFAAGAQYDINNHWSVDAQWMLLAPVGSSDNNPAANLFTGGISYHFAI